jgi:hypothetical protein
MPKTGEPLIGATGMALERRLSIYIWMLTRGENSSETSGTGPGGSKERLCLVKGFYIHEESMPTYLTGRGVDGLRHT